MLMANTLAYYHKATIPAVFCLTNAKSIRISTLGSEIKYNLTSVFEQMWQSHKYKLEPVLKNFFTIVIPEFAQLYNCLKFESKSWVCIHNTLFSS